jgi:phage shock protein C
MTTQQRLSRSSTDKVLGGVCGGLAHYFGIDPVIVRLIMIALFFAGGMSLFIYPALWLVMPVDGMTQPTLGAGLRDMRQQVQSFGQQASQQVQSAFSAPPATPRFDPQTGQPLNASNSENRSRVLGLVLLGIGTLMLASFFPYGGQLVFALMILGGGLYLLRRSN